MLGILRNIIFSILSILCFGVTPGLCAEVVTSEDVLGQGRSVERVFGEFLQASLPLRFKYEFGGKMLESDEGDRLVNLCEKAQAELEAMHSVQAGLKKRIEEYEGMDWDVLDVLYRKGWIRDPVGKQKSVHITEQGAALAATYLEKHFGK